MFKLLSVKKLAIFVDTKSTSSSPKGKCKQNPYHDGVDLHHMVQILLTTLEANKIGLLFIHCIAMNKGLPTIKIWKWLSITA